VRGYSFFGFSLVYIIFQDDTDIYWARSRVLEYLNYITSRLPKGATASLGPDATGVGWVYEYALVSDRHSLGELRAVQDWYIRYQLTTVPGVAEVASVGGHIMQYQVEVDPNKLLAHNIPLNKIMMAIRNSNQQVGGRLLEMSEAEYMVRGLGYIKTLDDIRNIVIGLGSNGTPIFIKDIATVGRGPDIRRGVAELDGKGEVVGGIVVMRFGKNALDVIKAVKQKIKEIEPGLPQGVKVITTYDRSNLIHRAIDTLKDQLIEEMVVVTLICLLFLWHVRSAFVAAITVPLGILLSFIIMHYQGINANIMSLGGIAIAIGVMVDASVVMVENTHKMIEHRGEEMERWELVIESSKQVGPALFFSLLIVTVSFLPVFTLQAQEGRLFTPLAFTKTYAMGASAILAITLIPVLMGFFIRGKIKPEDKNPLNRFLIWAYRPFVKFAIRFSWLTVLLSVGLIAATYYPLKQLGSEFMPPLNEGDILYMPTTLPGVSITEAKRLLQIQDKILRSYPEVEIVFGKIGRAETATDPAPIAMVETTVTLKPQEEWLKRKLKKRFLVEPAEAILKRWEAKRTLQSTLASVQKTGFTPVANSETVSLSQKQLQTHARDMEAMTRQRTNETVRLSLMQGIEMEEILLVLPNWIAWQFGQDFFAVLQTGGVLNDSQKEEIEKFASVAMTRQLEGERIPMERTTFEDLMWEEMDAKLQWPGLTNAWTMPIKTRLDMLATGIKTPIGIKVFGDDLKKIETLAIQVEKIVRGVPGTLSVYAERVMGGKYVDFEIDREQAARYGLTVGDVQRIIQSAVGGMNITTTVEGRQRFPVNLRYAREFRDTPDQLKRVLIPTPNGSQIPLGQLAEIQIKDGPPGIKSENALLQAIVYVDIKGRDLGGYVRDAQAAVAKAISEGRITIPPGYYLSWSGQFEYMQRANKRLKLIVPITLGIIFLLLYFNFKNMTESLIVMGSMPFALVGGIWLMYYLKFNMSIAVALGFIALAGLAAETGVVMLTFLDDAYNRRKAEGQNDPENRGGMTKEKLYDAIMEGAVLRVRPKMMTVGTTLIALLPILWKTGTGARVMKRIATPMVGGLISSTILTLIVIPAIYAIWKGFEIPAKSGIQTSESSQSGSNWREERNQKQSAQS
jgi:Cu(I)/Ag(I) efflux system membrane protein CusA/SilA